MLLADRQLSSIRTTYCFPDSAPIKSDYGWDCGYLFCAIFGSTSLDFVLNPSSATLFTQSAAVVAAFESWLRIILDCSPSCTYLVACLE